jgi:3-hydroxybutyryl-CoA dehydrogenase
MDIQKIGVIGAGQMGGGIAQVCALKGFDVTVLDISEDAIAKGRERLESSLARDVERGRLAAEDRDEALAHLNWGTEYGIFGDSDMVIEAATEDEDIKKAILRKLCEVVPSHTLIASNTSSISITRLAAQTDRPGQFCGMHFMNPVPRMQLVELIRGIATDEDTYQTVRDVTDKLGKTAVNAEDFPAFIVNRILLPMINEAIYTLYEGVGSVAAIDTAMKLGTNHPMGPLELADFIGLDTCLAVMHVLHEGLADTKYRPCPLLVKYVEAGWLGKKTNRGFYDYSGDEPVPTR